MEENRERKLKILSMALDWNKWDNKKYNSEPKIEKLFGNIIGELKKHNPDIIFMTEFQEQYYGKARCCRIIEELSDEYLWNRACYNEKDAENNMNEFIAVKKYLFNDNDITADNIISEKFINRMEHLKEWNYKNERNWLGICLNSKTIKDIVGRELHILGIHIVVKEREHYWDKIKNYACEKKDKYTIILGDFNAFYKEDIDRSDNDNCEECKVEDWCSGDCSISKPDDNLKLCKSQVDELGFLFINNWIDAWEEAHKYKAPKDVDRFTWYSSYTENKPNTFVAKSVGRRLDYAFLSPSLKKLIDEGKLSVIAEHLHDVRQKGLSDHSALIIELDFSKAPDAKDDENRNE